MASAGRSEPVFGRSLESAAAEARRWWQGALALAGLSLLLFVANVVFGELRSGNAWGLAYGSVALVAMLVAAGFGLRRRTMHWAPRLGLGRSRAWLYAHLYAGSLFLLFLGMHTGFGLPGGPLAWCLWALSLWTVATGLLGLGLQRWLPRVMSSALDIEVHYERIPALVDALAERAREVAESSGDDVRRLYARRVAAELAAPQRRWRYFLDPKGTIEARLRPFEPLRALLEGEERSRLDELEQLFRSKLEMDAHYTLQRPLRSWLFLHVPTSLLLLAAVALHLFAVWYY